MLNIYAKRCQYGINFKNKSIDEIMAFLDDKMRYHIDWWLNGENAVNYGFMDGICLDTNADYLKKQWIT